MEVTHPQLLTAIRSLYLDQLKPTGRVILRRVREHVAEAAARAASLSVEDADTDAVPRVDPSHLQGLCQSCVELRVVRDHVHGYAAYLVDAPPHCVLVDVDSAEDPYPTELWSELDSFFATLRSDDPRFAGGRYVFAKALAGRGLPSLSQRSLGEVCHIVALAIAQRKLLGYLDGRVVPFRFSKACAKQCGSPNEAPASQNVAPAISMAEMRRGLQIMLQSPQADITLGNVKEVILRSFHKDLNETALGYTRLEDVFSDPCLQDICILHGQRLLLRAATPPWCPAAVGQPSTPNTARSFCSSKRAAPPEIDVSTRCPSKASPEHTTSDFTSPSSRASTVDATSPGKSPSPTTPTLADDQHGPSDVGDSDDPMTVCPTMSAGSVCPSMSAGSVCPTMSGASQGQDYVHRACSLPTVSERWAAGVPCHHPGNVAKRTFSREASSSAEDVLLRAASLPTVSERGEAGVGHEGGAVGRRPSAGGWETMHIKRPQVLAAIRSLYLDRLKPSGRMILRRLREHAAEAMARAAGLHADDGDIDTAPRVDPRALQRICRSCNDLRVIQEGDREYAAYLVDQPRALFVDTDSSEDPYTEDLWSSLTAYFESIQGGDAPLGGRYVFAKALVKRRLPCLLMRSLGEVCHIVGLAICQRRLLGYLEGNVVPFAQSEACAKKWCALNEMSMSKSGLPAATIEEVRDGARVLLQRSAGAGLVFAALKRHFRECFKKEFSETALGYVRIRDVFNDPRLREVCVVQGDRIFSRMAKGSAPPPSPLAARTQAAEAPLAFGGEDDEQLVSRVRSVRSHQEFMPFAAQLSDGGVCRTSSVASQGARRLPGGAAQPESNFGPEARLLSQGTNVKAASNNETVRVTHLQILAAIRTLYADELKPAGRMVLRRVREHMAAAAARAAGQPAEEADLEHGPRVDARSLQKLCMSCGDLRVVHEGSREYAAYLVDQPHALFVDVESSEDPYPPELWAALAVHFESLEDTRLATGRYALAKALMKAQLPCLAQRSLGQVCHIVALAIAQRRLLGYSEGQVVAFSKSEACAKKWCALNELPMLSSGLPAATLEEAREGLSTMLRHPGAELNLATVKQAFRTHFRRDLSETALGHVRLRALLLDIRFHDVCTVKGDVILPGPGCFAASLEPLHVVAATPSALAPMPFRPPPGL